MDQILYSFSERSFSFYDNSTAFLLFMLCFFSAASGFAASAYSAIPLQHFLLSGMLHAIPPFCKKNVPWHILAPRRGCFNNHLPFAPVRIPAERLLFS